MKQRGLGSGVIIDERGYVLTNYHVIVRASRVSITLVDNREFEAKIVGTDPKSDLAVLKVVTEEQLPVAAIGRSNDLLIGEPVIAAIDGAKFFQHDQRGIQEQFISLFHC